MPGWIMGEVIRNRPVAESMTSLIDQCESIRPHPDWAKLRALPYSDFAHLLRWIKKPFRQEPPKKPLKGLWFGLFNPCPNGRTPVADIYVCGSERFHPDPEDNNWAVGPDWWPNARYANSTVLADIYRIAYRQDSRGRKQDNCLGIDADYPLVLGYGAFAIRELLERVDPLLLLGRAKSLGVAVGFDSGDFVLLGKITKGGLKRINSKFKRRAIPIKSILEELRSSDKMKVSRAVTELNRLGERAQAAIPEFLLFVDSDLAWRRHLAIYMLATIAPDDPRTKSAALQALKDIDPYVRRQALQSLISIKDLSHTELERIKNMENDADRDVARWSEIAIRNIRLQGRLTP
jgi:hypothetical protein